MNALSATARLHATRLRLQIAVWRHGVGWALAAVAAGAAAGLELGVVQADRIALKRLQAPAPAAIARATPSAPMDIPDGRAALMALLRDAPATEAQLRQLAALAEATPIGLSRADYQRRPLTAVPLVQWQVTQPVRATYPALRRYAQAVLRELPNASLDEITAHRDEIGQGQVEARLRWSLWLPVDAHAHAHANKHADAIARAAELNAPSSGDIVSLIPREALIPPPGGQQLPNATHAATRDLFAAHSWALPTLPLAAAPAPPAAPTAPPLPFTYLGKKLEDSRWDVFVAHEDRSLVLREGDVAAAQWRVDRIAPPTLTLTYLPLGQAQTLAIGDDR